MKLKRLRSMKMVWLRPWRKVRPFLQLGGKGVTDGEIERAETRIKRRIESYVAIKSVRCLLFARIEIEIVDGLNRNRRHLSVQEEDHHQSHHKEDDHLVV